VAEIQGPNDQVQRPQVKPKSITKKNRNRDKSSAKHAGPLVLIVIGAAWPAESAGKATRPVPNWEANRW
jgi:hypothetical protein